MRPAVSSPHPLRAGRVVILSLSRDWGGGEENITSSKAKGSDLVPDGGAGNSTEQSTFRTSTGF